MLIAALVAPVLIPIAALVLVLALAKLERVLLDGGDRTAPAADEQDAPAGGTRRGTGLSVVAVERRRAALPHRAENHDDCSAAAPPRLRPPRRPFR